MHKYRCPIEVGRSIFDYPPRVRGTRDRENFETKPHCIEAGLCFVRINKKMVKVFLQNVERALYLIYLYFVPNPTNFW